MLLFSKLNQIFFGIHKISYKIMKIIVFRCELTDISAKNEALLTKQRCLRIGPTRVEFVSVDHKMGVGG